jgi:hypothetical protein
LQEKKKPGTMNRRKGRLAEKFLFPLTPFLIIPQDSAPMQGFFQSFLKSPFGGGTAPVFAWKTPFFDGKFRLVQERDGPGDVL